MTTTLIATGDINLMNVEDPDIPFNKVKGALDAADMVFSNLECCLFVPPVKAVESEGFFVAPATGMAALKAAGVDAVGIANNVNYGEKAISSSIRSLDKAGIAHTGAGANSARARKPVILTHRQVAVGFLQRSSVYWPTDHEAGPNTTGIAVIRGHTAYQVPEHRARPGLPPMNRPGIPPSVITWADPAYLKSFADDIAELKKRTDVVVASCHWGFSKDILDYMREIAHAAIDAGADLVIGHGPHYSLAIEVYKGRPIFYGLGSFSFHTGHQGKKHGNWLGMMAKIEIDDQAAVQDVRFRLVRHNNRNETVLCRLKQEKKEVDDLCQRSKALGAALKITGDEIVVPIAAAKPVKARSTRSKAAPSRKQAKTLRV